MLKAEHKPANAISWLNFAPMQTLKERLREVMAAKGWEQSDLMRISGESSSVVSQWLGKGSKEIKSIGKMEAAERIEAASGFSSLWIAKGLSQKRQPDPVQTLVAHEMIHPRRGQAVSHEQAHQG